MREPVSASVALGDLLEAARPFVELAAEKLSVLHVPGVGASVIVQPDPLVACLLVEGPATACPGLTLEGAAIPGHVELAAAVEQLLAAGLSACPPSVVEGIVSHASKPGAGLFVWLRPGEGVACYLAPAGVDLSRAARLFSVEVGASAAGPSAKTFTVH